MANFDTRSFISMAIIAVVISTMAAVSARAAELLVFERPGCPFCAAFDREVASIYPRTDEGKAIPARHIDVTQPIPSDIAFVKVERLTPVFVLVDAGREIGRFRGYSGDDHFWGLFGKLVERLREQSATGDAAGRQQDERASGAVPLAAPLER
jgi:thioredoxin-related protein